MSHLFPELKDQRILIAPLNWGLGHATRSLPLIQYYAEHNHIEVCSDGLALDWLKRELPAIKMHDLPGYDIIYDKRPSIRTQAVMARKVAKAVAQEYEAAKDIIQGRRIDVVISDHRLGVRQKGVKSILLAHQLQIPFNSSLWRMSASFLHKVYINRFDECWIPDHREEDRRLSGTMSNLAINIPKRYIGPLSRFKEGHDESPDVDILVILSGVEPDRTRLEERLLRWLRDMTSYNAVIIRGTHRPKPSSYIEDHDRVTMIDLADTEELQSLLRRSKLIVARSGYSTLMDLQVVKKPAIFIPSQHQAEQLYLGRRADENPSYTCIHEHELSQKKLFTEVKRLLRPSK